MPSKAQQISLPEGLDLVGIYKFKDKEGRQAIKIKITGDVRELIVQKVKGANNTMVIAVRRGEYEYAKIITPPEKKIIIPR